MYRFENFLSTLEHYELVRLKQEIEKGGLDVIKEIQGNIKDLEKRHSISCMTCSNTLDPYNTNNYTIIFGPDDFRKKASFCGLDCLEYFLIKLKKMKKDSRTKTANLVDDKNAKKIE
ncbi:MAG: hypothetical protein IH934_03830 [Nanoarchaeota archaeon]|nr:hypothetical protein [Nanoarchaeota archaeon]